ncbi:MAG: S53 family peptidase [Acidimicrobiales bacterium]
MNQAPFGASRLALTVLLCLGTLTAAAVPALAAPSPSGSAHSGSHAGAGSQGSTNSASQETASQVCGSTAPGFARCLSWRRTDAAARSEAPATDTSPGMAATTAGAAATLGNNGAYDPSYLQSAYGVFNAAGGAGQTVAIVDAYDDPNAASDLTTYRSGFGLPACTGSCFRKVNETGGSALPAPDSGWAQEISLDLDMVSAICPRCSILLVEASSASYVDLGKAVNTAVSLGAKVVSNSYGGAEFGSEDTYSTSYYDHPGVAVVASSGDSGYGVEFPAASEYVTAAGGTSLTQTGNTGTRNATETAWSGAGSGCSAYEPKPAWQHDAGCARRTVADLSADADPNTGVWVYDTYGGSGPWMIFGGTSVASPIIASFFALGGTAGTATATNPTEAWPYAAPAGSLTDIVSGSNGSCGGTYLCTAVTGYDGPTGLGTPLGTAAFIGSNSGGSTGGGSGGTGTGGTVSPPGPFTLKATTDPTKGVDLSWTLSSGTATSGYLVLRSTTQSGLNKNPQKPGGLNIQCGSTGCTARDTSTSSGKTYWYEVVASNSAGKATSNAVSVKAR